MMLALFCKNPVHATLTGLTHHPKDLGVHQLKFSLASILKKFAGAHADAIDVKINSLGLPGDSGATGEVVFSCCVLQRIPAFQWEEPGLVDRVRGVVFTRKMSPEAANAIIKRRQGGPHAVPSQCLSASRLS